MFRTQLPSMPPSIQGNLPSFHTLQHRPPTSCHFEEAGAYQQKSFGHSQTSAVPSNLGLRTPPVEMTGVNTNPLLAPTLGGSQYKSVPLLASNAGAHHTNLSTVANPNYATKFQHHHPSFHATSDQHTASDRYNPNTQRPSYRRTSSDGNSIASYLQIPKSITQSEGSLAEFAAQITCLFWFESSTVLSTVEASRDTPTPIAPLVPEAIPSMGFRKWVTTILSTTQVTQNVIILALMFIYRLKKLNPSVKGKIGSEYRLLTVALMLGNKFLDDNTYTNKTWAEVSGISVQEIHIMEVEFLSNMRYTLYASEAEWETWQFQLSRFWQYFDGASKTPLSASPNYRYSSTPGMSLPTLPTNLPSPPSSTHTSPPSLTSHPPKIQTHSHPLSLPPYLPPSIPASSTYTPEPDLRLSGRKRSRDEYAFEPPLKRVASSLASSASSSTILTPSTLPGGGSSAPRLPMPNLSISIGNQGHGYTPTSSAQPPCPGRAMSTVFTGPTRWPANGTLPSLHQSTHPSLVSSSSASSPMSDWQSRNPSYSQGSATPSPTAYNFPSNSQTPTHLSPSGFPVTRNSPYKPVRSVNTLLAPPPSTSMHHAPQNLSYEQMHYQPLGKPFSERRAGVVPFMSHDTWSHTNRTPNPLPPPMVHH